MHNLSSTLLKLAFVATLVLGALPASAQSEAPLELTGMFIGQLLSQALQSMHVPGAALRRRLGQRTRFRIQRPMIIKGAIQHT